MRKRLTINLGAILCVAIATYCLDILLLDSIMPLSIGSVQVVINSLSKHSHIFAIGFIPLYIGLMVFGTSLLAFYFGKHLQHLVIRFFSRQSYFPAHCKSNVIYFVRKNP